MIAVTPVRTGPLPTTSLPSPRMIVVYPPSTPATSVIAFNGPVVPSNGTPRSRARTVFVCDVDPAGDCCGSRACALNAIRVTTYREIVRITTREDLRGFDRLQSKKIPANLTEILD